MSAESNRPGLPQLLVEPPDFSLVLGGPLYQLLRRAHLSDDALTLVHRRIAGAVAITWLPLLLFAAWEGLAWNRDVIRIPFLFSIETHVRATPGFKPMAEWKAEIRKKIENATRQTAKA